MNLTNNKNYLLSFSIFEFTFDDSTMKYASDMIFIFFKINKLFIFFYYSSFMTFIKQNFNYDILIKIWQKGKMTTFL